MKIENPAEFVGSVAVANKPDRTGAAELYARTARRDKRRYAVSSRSRPLSPNLQRLETAYNKEG